MEALPALPVAFAGGLGTSFVSCPQAVMVDVRKAAIIKKDNIFFIFISFYVY
jgi:hypothetical protein